MRTPWRYPAALSALYLSMTALADPRGAFCLNDDFVYAGAVRGWLGSGRLRLSQWALAPNLAHIASGAAAGLLARPSNENLRFFNVALGLCAVLLFWKLLLDLGASPKRALAGAALLAANPLFLAMSASFHAEINSLLWQLAGAWFLLAGPRRVSLPRLAAASLFFGLAAANRPTMIASAAGAAAFLWTQGRLGRREAAALLLPAAALFAASLLWLRYVNGPTWAWLAGRHLPTLADALPAPAECLKRLEGSLQTAALLLVPLALGAWSRLRKSRPSGLELGVMGAVAALAVLELGRGEGLPLLGNTLHRRGLGVLTLEGPEAKLAGLWASGAAWHWADALALASSAALVRVLWPARKSPAARALLWIFLPAFLPLLALQNFFDRYLLVALPGVIAAGVLAVEDGAFSSGLCLAGCLVLAALSTAGLRDYLSWNRARWQAGESAVARGLSPASIANGFDWDGQFSLERNLEKLLSERPASEIGIWDWQKENRILLVTSFSPSPPREDFVLAGRFGYETPLSSRPAFVYVYGYAPALKPRK